jgi:signal transduction histidine kinase
MAPSPSDLVTQTQALELLQLRIDALTNSRARLLWRADTERQRLERDLHDGAQQRLIAVMQRIELAQQALADGDDGETAALLEASLEQLAIANDELRVIARGLDPVELHGGRLDDALAALAESSLVPVDLEVTSAELPEPLRGAVYYVVAEALANTTKHAGADGVAVCVTLDGRSVVAEVADDGCGGACPSDGSGLVGLRDRVETLGGRLTIVSPEGGGTRLRAHLPLDVAA